MPDVLVDIGNTRMKFCRSDPRGLILPVRGLTDSSRADWEHLVEEWGLPRGSSWAIAATNPAPAQRFTAWAEARGDRVQRIASTDQIPMTVRVDEPTRVGVDRLLDCLAARARLAPGQPAIVVDAGSAVTVNFLDPDGAFAGGAIFPGPRLMAEALHAYTAQLPLVDTAAESPPPELPARNTVAAIQSGILHAVAGGIDSLIHELAARCSIAPVLFLTGGAMTPRLTSLLQSRHAFRSELRPTLTLEGLFLAARAPS